MALDLERYLSAMAASLQDASATLELTFGGLSDTTRVRLWRGQVLVDWEPDEEAGGCLLRPDLVRRLAALGATVEQAGPSVHLRARPRVVAKLSQRHANLGAQLGVAPALRVDLRFDAEGSYRGGAETYLVEGGSTELLALRVSLEPRLLPGTSARTARDSG